VPTEGSWSRQVCRLRAHGVVRLVTSNIIHCTPTRTALSMINIFYIYGRVVVNRRAGNRSIFAYSPWAGDVAHKSTAMSWDIVTSALVMLYWWLTVTLVHGARFVHALCDKTVCWLGSAGQALVPYSFQLVDCVNTGTADVSPGVSPCVAGGDVEAAWQAQVNLCAVRYPLPGWC
jgi:hypothetical protein